MFNTTHLEMIEKSCTRTLDLLLESTRGLSEFEWTKQVIALQQIVQQLQDRKKYIEDLRKEDEQVANMIESTFGIEIERGA